MINFITTYQKEVIAISMITASLCLIGLAVMKEVQIRMLQGPKKPVRKLKKRAYWLTEIGE